MHPLPQEQHEGVCHQPARTPAQTPPKSPCCALWKRHDQIPCLVYKTFSKPTFPHRDVHTMAAWRGLQCSTSSPHATATLLAPETTFVRKTSREPALCLYLAPILGIFVKMTTAREEIFRMNVVSRRQPARVVCSSSLPIAHLAAQRWHPLSCSCPEPPQLLYSHGAQELGRPIGH